ncbi:OLC1v1025303C1 [Oldenlandia corymbosa var. corymbosa]|uniref:OLC1v1025303C1 n=1 Tax=Oldenlandia corymbosa var. corymbosa TaxID=529605 RepID=A0AAV1C4G0_OLDCO|nr:OLC1v1025303C1 [Oldenlandia corymbosa var. corymbosa]
MNNNIQRDNLTIEGNNIGTLGFRCFYCSQKYLSSHALAGHQKAHVRDPKWVKDTRHERVFIPLSENHHYACKKRVIPTDVPERAPPNPNIGMPWIPTFVRFYAPYTRMIPAPNYRPLGQIYLPHRTAQITYPGCPPGFNPSYRGVPDSSSTANSADFMNKYMRKGTGFVINRQPVQVKRKFEEIDLELRL